MSYKCHDCDKTFTTKQSLQYHITKRACKDLDYHCKYCNKRFASESSMYRHIRTVCVVKKENDEEKESIFEKLCNMQEEIDSLKKELKISKNVTTNTMNNQNQCAENINNGTVSTVNNNNNNNIILVGFGQEDMSILSKAEILSALHKGFMSTVKLTELVHFNPKYPEYHNVFISNMKDKYAMMYDGDKWVLKLKDEIIDTIYDDNKNHIEETIEEFITSLPQSRKDALKRWLDTDENNPKIKEIKEQIRLVLYNNKDMGVTSMEISKQMPKSVKEDKIPVPKDVKRAIDEEIEEKLKNKNLKEIEKEKSVRIIKNINKTTIQKNQQYKKSTNKIL